MNTYPNCLASYCALPDSVLERATLLKKDGKFSVLFKIDGTPKTLQFSDVTSNLGAIGFNSDKIKGNEKAFLLMVVAFESIYNKEADTFFLVDETMTPQQWCSNLEDVSTYIQNRNASHSENGE